MRGKANLLARKVFATIIALTMSIPPQAMASGTGPVIYDASSSVMGIAQEDKAEIKVHDENSSQITKELKDYILDIDAKLDSSLTELTYTIKVRRKEKIEDDSTANLSFNLTGLENSNITDLRLVDASTDVEVIENQDKEDKIKNLAIKAKPADEIIFTIKAAINKAKDARIYDLKLALSKDNENFDTFSYKLKSEEKTTIENGQDIQVMTLVQDLETKPNPAGTYKEEGIFGGIFTAKDTITWTDYVLNEEENKEFVYDFNLDSNQETENAKIALDYYEATEHGFEIKKEFSQAIDFAKKINFEIPQNFIAKITLTTQVDKKNTAIKDYSLNNKKTKNPIYIEGSEEKSSDDDEEGVKEESEESKEVSQNNSQQEHAEENQEAKGTEDDIKIEDANSKDKEEEKSTQEDLKDSTIVVKDSSGKEIPLEVKENPAEEEEDKTNQISALILNKDSLLSQLREENTLTTEKENAIKNLAENLDSYNDEKITDQELKDFTKAQAENLGIEKTDLRFFIESILSGLNKQTNKAANLNIDEIIDYAYPENVDPKDGEEDESQENPEENITEEKTEKPEQENLPEEKTEIGQTEEKDPGKTFDEDLAKLKEEAKNEENQPGLLEGLKSLVGLTDLAKADKELKAALADEKNGIEEIQNLLDSFEEKYNLSRADQAKLMDDNGEAIRALVEKDRENNFRPHIFADTGANGNLNLNDKKFTVRTILQTSNIGGSIQDDQYFKIHLDEKLTVKNPSELKDIVYNGSVIARPTYDEATNVITYKIEETFPENVNIPLEIPVDYDTSKITDSSFDNNGLTTITNSVSGLGVTNPKSLLPEQIDKNGNPAGTIIEPGLKDVTKIIEPDDSNYKVDADAYAIPVVKDGKLQGYNWTVKISSDTDLNELGLKVNFTEVVGSGLGEIQNSNVELEDQLEGAFGIHDSKHHAPDAGIKEITYKFYTPVQGMQEKYMMDISIILTEKGKVGAKRFVMDGWPADKVKEATPIRSGMNNRTTILGEFTGEKSVKWTVTDAISTGDNQTSLPLEKNRTVSVVKKDKTTGSIPLGNVKAVYRIDDKTGKMVSNGTNIGQTNPVGTIAVWEENISEITGSEHLSQTLSGVRVSKYKDIYVDQNWNLDEGIPMPAQTLKAVDPSDENNILGSTGENDVPEQSVEEGAQASRSITIPNVKVWNIQGVREFTKTQPKIVQTFPTDKTYNGEPISYYENHNYYDPNTNAYNIHNRGTVEEVPNRASFTIVKTDKKDPNKKLAGARFKLLGGPEVITDANGEAVFNNIAPGTYTIIETKAPNGYKSNEENATINIDEEGRVNLEGGPASISAGANPTQTVEHGSYPDYMNAMQYATKDDKGNVTTYIFLKANEAQRGGSTDRDTRLNLRMDNGSIANVEVFDVDPYSQRNPLKSAMTQQTADQMVGQLGRSVLNYPHTYPINGKANVTDSFTNNTGYQISIPKERFANDWGYLVKVTGTGDSLTYDWLTNENTGNQAKLQDQKIVPSTSNDTDKATKITITNEAFETRQVGLTKVDKDNNPLAGATFVIKDANGDVISTETSGEDGKVSFGNMPGGKYTIEETEAPEGYVKSNVIFEVTVEDSKQVTYIPKFKNGSGYPVNGEDYFIKDMEQGQDDSRAIVTRVTQDLYVNDKDGGGIGSRPGIWEAYFLESLSYTANIQLENSAPGTRFSIQFDPNLDFTQYFSEFPKIVKDGKEIADPYFDYTTNKLTYVFNENSKGGPASADIKLVGIIPSKYYAKNDGTFTFNVTVAPGQTNLTGNTITRDIKADYDYYDYDRRNVKPTQAYYFRDVYKDEKGDWYVTALAYYNPHYVNSGFKDVLNFNWESVKNYTAGEWQGDGTKSLYDLTDVKIYRTAPNMGTIQLPELQTQKPVNYNMPLSFGVRPEQDPSTYHLIYSRTIDPNKKIVDDKNGDVVLNYDPSILNTFGKLKDKGPLSIQMPSVNNTNKDGYIIEQTFKIDDINKFNNIWRAFNMSNGTFNSTFATRGNASAAIGDQTGGEIPKFYSQEVGLFNKRYEPGKFKILKQNETNNAPLSGASFSLTDEDNNVIYRSSGTDGIVNFENLKPGSYILKEEIPPTGFVKTDRRWNVNVSIDGNVTITEIGLNVSGETLHGKEIQIPVGNKPTATKFRVYKKDDQNQPLAGAEFKLTKQGETTAFATAISDASGVVTFSEELTKGTYILEETKSPEGYQKLYNKWVVEVDDSNKVKIYTYNEKQDSDPETENNQYENSILFQENVYWVNVSQRPTDKFITDDNRQTGYADRSTIPYKLGTRIVGINKTDNYAIQRYVINPEGKDIDIYDALVHREKLNYDNMKWYEGNEEVKIYTLDKPVTTNVEDIRLYAYNLTDITDKVDKSSLANSDSDRRLQLVFNEDKLKGTDGSSLIKGKPIIVDVKIPYTSEYGGVGTGMDLNTSEGLSWKSDYYEQVSDIVVGNLINKDNITDDIKGSYVSDDYLDVTNKKKRYEFSIDKVNEKENDTGGHDAVTGATFKLVGPQPSEDIRWTNSDENGKVSFKDLVPGIYNLVETGAAKGYEKANTDWTVTVTKDGKIYIRDNNPGDKLPDPNPETKWQEVSDIEGTNANRTRNVDDDTKGRKLVSYITEVNLATKKFRQVYVLNKAPERLSNPTLEIHAYDENRDLTTDNTRIISIKEVGSASEPHNIVREKGNIPYTIEAGEKEGHKRLVLKTDVTGEKTLAVEIESDLPETGTVGTGMDFKALSRTYWGAEKYTNKDAINLSPIPESTVDKNAVVYVGGDKLPGGNSIVENPGTNNKKPVLYSQDSGLVARNLAPRSILSSNEEDLQPMTLRSAVFRSLTSDGLEIGDDLVGTAVGAGNVEYTIGNTKNAQLYGGTEVTTSVKEIGGGTFEVQIDLKNTSEKYYDNNPVFDFTFNNNFDFVANSTLSWYGDIRNAPTTGWHTGYDPNTKKIGIQAGKPKIYKNQTYSMKFSVKAKSELASGTYDIIGNIFYKHDSNKNTSMQTIDPPTVTVKKNEPVITYRDGYEDTTIEMTTETRNDPNLEVGKTRTEEGQDGTKRTYYKYKIVDGTETGEKTLDTSKGNNGEEIITPMKPKIIYTGTKQPGQTGYTVSYNTPENGTLEVSPTRANAGDTITVTATPNDGYELDSLSVTANGEPVTVTDNQFTMPAANVTVSASFKKVDDPTPQTYNVTVIQPTEGGTISANAESATKGTEVTLGANPATGYVLDKFTVTDAQGNNVPVSGNKFEMPASDVTVSASFKKSEDPLDSFVPEEGRDILVLDGESAKIVKITNKKVGITPKVIKTDSYGTMLEGATFIIKKMTDDKYDTVDDTFKVLEGTSDKDGNVIFKDEEGNVVKLEKGYYLMTEEKSPDGYKRITAPWKMEVKYDRGRMYSFYWGPEDTPSSFIDDNETNAEAKLEITAINQKNEISFKKTNSEGKALEGAKFALVKYDDTTAKWTEVTGSEKTTGEDGLVNYEKLAPGKYALIEKKAPAGYNKIEGHIEEFTVDKDGIITREVTRPKGSDAPGGTTPEDGTQPDTPEPGTGTTTQSLRENVLNTVANAVNKAVEALTGEKTETVNEPIGTEPINVVNYKNIEFVKVDGDDNTNTLAGAVFEIHYKDKENGNYGVLTKKETEGGTEVDKPIIVTSGEDGKFKLPISKDGYYALVETKAPDNYTKAPGYIREFKLESGSISVLEKDPLKASLTRSKKGQIVSQVLSVDKDKKTFTQRIVINPKHESLTGINDTSYLRILENGWSITPKSNTEIGGGQIKVALLKENPDAEQGEKKSIGELEDTDFKTYDPVSYTTVGTDTGSRYSLKALLGKANETTDISTTDTIVVEYTGTLDDITKPVEQKAEFIIDNTILDNADYSLDINMLSSTGPIYVDLNKSNITPIPVENRKAEYPNTGGPGMWIGFTIVGLAVMIGGAYIYHKRKESIDSKI